MGERRQQVALDRGGDRQAAAIGRHHDQRRAQREADQLDRLVAAQDAGPTAQPSAPKRGCSTAVPCPATATRVTWPRASR